MREIRVFTDQPLSSGVELVLDPVASRHLSVLRLKEGQNVTVFNGAGGEFSACITSANGKHYRLNVGEHNDREAESPLKIHLGIGMSRGERMDTVVQKATELGVTEITPLYTERTEVKLKGDRTEKKMRHWQQIIVSACEQCGRNRLPELHPPRSIQEWLGVSASYKFVLHDRSYQQLCHYTERPRDIALLVGPEGGLSAAEIEAALGEEFQALTLGPRVLRTETAPLATISIVQSLWGDMG